ncbi:MAG: hypothetical protein PVJ71_01205 [Lysobacterales bacterium]|jgi:hypothetical protein
MIDKTDFSIDIPVDPHAGFKPMPDLYAFDLCKAYPMSGERVLLHNTRNGRRTIVEREVHASLVHCNEFQTLEQHTDNIIAQNPGMQGQQDDIRGVLEKMCNAGIMRSAKSFTEALKKRPADYPTDERNPVAAIITCERPEALERLLASIGTNCDTSKLHCLYVIDDSRSAENADRNRALAGRYAEQLDAPLHYLGQAEQQAFISNLVQQLPQHENAIRFLVDQRRWVDHFTAGLSRNVAQLLSCGRRLVVLDDDVICEVYLPPTQKPNISIGDGAREADFFANEAGWSHLREAINPDPLDRHLHCLGLELSQSVSKLGAQNIKPTGLQGASSLLVSEMQPDSPILLTECGSYGCPGTTDNTWLPDIAPQSLKNMLASAKKTSNALSTRKVWSGRGGPYFSPRPNMSPILGMDNRQFLPPYLPILRGEDRLFGFMLDFLHPTSVTLDYPWAVPHLPMPERDWQMKHLEFKPHTEFPMFFFEQVQELRPICRATDPGNRLTTLVAWFNDLSGTPNDTFTNLQRDATLAVGTRQLAHLKELLAAAETAPVEWQNYLRNGIRSLNTGLASILQGEFSVRSVQSGMEGAALTAFWRETWKGFATALAAWPEIREAAATLTDSAATAWN